MSFARSLDHGEGSWGTGRFPTSQSRQRAAIAAARVVERRRGEGGAWGKHGFPHGSAAKPRDVIEAYLGAEDSAAA
jgi:hypothetical protein